MERDEQDLDLAEFPIWSALVARSKWDMMKRVKGVKRGLLSNKGNQSIYDLDFLECQRD